MRYAIFALLASAIVAAVLLALPADAACHCVIVPNGGACDCVQTPPVHGIACDPANGDIEGCDKVFLMEVSR